MSMHTHTHARPLIPTHTHTHSHTHTHTHSPARNGPKRGRSSNNSGGGRAVPMSETPRKEGHEYQDPQALNSIHIYILEPDQRFTVSMSVRCMSSSLRPRSTAPRGGKKGKGRRGRLKRRAKLQEKLARLFRVKRKLVEASITTCVQTHAPSYLLRHTLYIIQFVS